MHENEIASLLRLHDEPSVHISETEAHGVLMEHCREFMQTLKTFYLEWNALEDAVDLPLKQVFVGKHLAGDFRVMPCTIDSKALKFVKVIGTNEEQRTLQDKISVGKALLIDYHDNYVYALFDVCALSSFRTAAISVLAMESSCPHTPDHAGIVGSGRIGFYTAYILYHWRGVRGFTVYDSSDASLQNFLALCRHYLPEATIACETLHGTIARSQVLFLATTSADALLSKERGAHLRFISSVGADADNLSELDASLLETHRLVTDSLQSMHLGDMKQWRQSGRMHAEPTELKDLIHEKRDDASAPHLFISTGVAVQDALVCQFIYEKICQ